MSKKRETLLAQEAAEKARQEKHARDMQIIYDRRKKESAWTREKLDMLVSQPIQKTTKRDFLSWPQFVRDYPQDPETMLENLRNIQPETLEPVQQIIETREKNPGEMGNDIDYVWTEIEQEWFVIDGFWMQKIQTRGKEYLIGRILEHYMFRQNFIIVVENKKITVQDTQTPKREQLRAQFEKTLQEKFSSLGIQDTAEIGNFLAASMYHDDYATRLVDQKNQLKERSGMQDGIAYEEQKKTILSSNKLNAEQKSFLLAFLDDTKDERLNFLQREQADFVKNAQQSIGRMSQADIIAGMKKAPLTTALAMTAMISPLIAPGVMIAGALWIVGMKRAAKVIGTVFIGWGLLLWGAGRAALMADKVFEAAVKKGEELPKHLGKYEMSPWLRERFNRSMTRPHGCLKLLMKDDNQRFLRYPIWPLLYALAKEQNITKEQEKYAAYKQHPDLTQIQDNMKTLSTEDQLDLFSLAWMLWVEKAKKHRSAIEQDQIRGSGNYAQFTLENCIGSLPDLDMTISSPFNDLKSEALQIFVPGMQAWRDTPLSEIIKRFELDDGSAIPPPPRMTPAEKNAFDAAHWFIGTARANATRKFSWTPMTKEDVLWEYFTTLYTSPAGFLTGGSMKNVDPNQTFGNFALNNL